MRAVDIIRKKRDGFELSTEEIQHFVTGATQKTWPEYQISALLMAIVCRGMSDRETADLTVAMVDSGTRLSWKGLSSPAVDKHSAGGVGDKTTLILVPLAAACGCHVPKMSGRGLAHTGGTLDKLESIPGYRIALSLEDYQQQVATVGGAIIGQTANLAPADKILYALRDVTGTVESIPLIAGSIMSKKLAEGISGVVLDIKVGQGAFMKTLADARKLAQTMVSIGKSQAVRTICLLTGMDAPLGKAIGNSLEVEEAILTLQGKGPKDLESLSVQLAAWLVVLSGKESDMNKAEATVRQALESGAGLLKLKEIVTKQGGDGRVVDDVSLLPQAQFEQLIPSRQDGYITQIDALKLGQAAMLLGAGREKVEDVIDHSVGILVEARLGHKVTISSPLAKLKHNQPKRLQEAITLCEQAFEVNAIPRGIPPLVLETVQ